MICFRRFVLISVKPSSKRTVIKPVCVVRCKNIGKEHRYRGNVGTLKRVITRFNYIAGSTIYLRLIRLVVVSLYLPALLCEYSLLCLVFLPMRLSQHPALTNGQPQSITSFFLKSHYRFVLINCCYLLTYLSDRFR